MKHTPGPWRIATGSDSLIVAGPNGLHIAQVATTGMGHAVLPNAKVIASAPAMLAELQFCADHITYAAGPEALEQLRLRMFKAIAQATGGNHDS